MKKLWKPLDSIWRPFVLGCLALSASVSYAQGAPFIRPRQEGTFKLMVSQPRPSNVTVIGNLGGYEVSEISSSIPLLSMGKATVVDRNGNIWFVDSREDKVIKVDPQTLEMTDYGVPMGAAPYSIAVDSKGTLWITAHGIEMLLEIRPEERIVISHAPPTHGFLIHIQVDQNTDTVYFGQPGANRVVAYHPEHGFREYLIPTPNAGPGRIDVDMNGNVWFPELYANKIARLEPKTGQIKEWDLPTKNALPAFCRVDRNNVVWISEPMADKIATFKNGVFHEYKVPTVDSVVSNNIADATGIVWFTEGGWRGSAGGNKIARLDPQTGHVDELSLPTRNAQPLGLAIDATGTMWFEESAAGKLVRLRPMNSQTNAARTTPSGK
jgi:streptogramin lyase